jgi:FkbM family methyltransferase
MNSIIKKIGYAGLQILTSRRGIARKINGVSIKFPTKYFRYFPAEYETENHLIFKEKIKSGDTVIDIGAHIGLMSVILGKLVGEKGEVYSFEPTPYTFSLLNKMIGLNKLQAVVKPVNKAVSDTSGFVEFSADTMDVSNSIVSYEHNSEYKKIKVPTISIDEFVKENKMQKLDFIKIDAEGVELDVLKGAKETLQKFRAKMILALHPLPIKAKGDSLEEIYDFLQQAGYKVIWKKEILSKEKFCEQQDMFDVFLEPQY